VARCLNGQQPLLSVSGLPQVLCGYPTQREPVPIAFQSCNIFMGTNACAQGYDCLQSSIPSTAICCLRSNNQLPPFTPTPTRCATSNRTPYMASGAIRTCVTGQLCPAGECVWGLSLSCPISHSIGRSKPGQLYICIQCIANNCRLCVRPIGRVRREYLLLHRAARQQRSMPNWLVRFTVGLGHSGLRRY
jgi:hypothetical protein